MYEKIQSESNTDFIHTLIDDYGEEVKRIIYSYLKDWQLTEDLTQEVFITVFLKMDTFEGRSSVKTWLYKIAINKTKDYLKSWSYKKVILTNTILTKTEINNSLETQLILKENDSEIAREVFGLPIKYREVILLFYYKDFTLKEIAAITNVNPSTVRTRLTRGRKILEQKLGGFLVES
ncbi:sigma-70 family RNA polymerase sigma factor [Falsibacillus albus]|uniref:sigma-70 family RNA polymerase sigma factor n=1 Tax=Falsibacillus albus TaxID=2478915 RepID=UPI001314B22B|nr:sigma-70 family RNA polymerase sigma factor [Falsibacillus albus]